MKEYVEYEGQHTGPQIDEMLNKAAFLSNPNLLDNWYFGKPVNQRGQTGYTGIGYGIDRWKTINTSSAYTLGGDGLTFTSKNLRFDQLLENPGALIGKTVTFSALIMSNNAAANTALAALVNGNAVNTKSIPAGAVGCFSTTFQVAEGFEGVRIYTTSGFTGDVTVAAVKLELGTQQTLAHQENGNWVLNEIPNYAEELAKCQRYYIKYGALTSAIHVGYVQAVTTGQANSVIHLPVSLRANPTIVTENMPTIRLGVKDTVATKVSLNWVNNNNLYFAIEAAGLTVGETYVLRLNNATLAFDANL